MTIQSVLGSLGLNEACMIPFIIFPSKRTPQSPRTLYNNRHVCTYLGMIFSVNSLGLRTRKARPCGSQLTMDVSSVPSTASSISCNFSGKGCAVVVFEHTERVSCFVVRTYALEDCETPCRMGSILQADTRNHKMTRIRRSSQNKNNNDSITTY